MRLAFRRGLVLVVLGVLSWGLAVGARRLASTKRRAARLEALDRLREPAEQQARRLKALADAVKAEPFLDADTRSLPLGGVSFVDGPGATGAFVDAAALARDELRRDEYRGALTFDETPFWGGCIRWLDQRARPASPDDAPPTEDEVERLAAQLEAFLAVKYLGVVRDRELDAPGALEDGGFALGRYRGEVLFYELTDAPRLLGGLRVVAMNDAAARETYRGQPRGGDETVWLRRALRERAWLELVTLMKQAAPETEVPPRLAEE